MYPFYAIGSVIFVLVMYGYYQQDKLMEVNERKMEHQKRVEDYSFK